MRVGIAAALVSAAAFAAVSQPDMLMDEAAAVEVTDGFTPPLPQPSMASQVAPDPVAPSTAPSKDCFILGSKTFSVPFTVNSTGVQPSEVHVFVKRDQSPKWDLLERKRPAEAASQAFQFTATADGEYWFATRTIDSRGRPHPSGEMTPQLKVYVDTTKPDVGLEVDANADGSVVAKVVIQDATPLKNIQLRYATDSVAEWKQVDLQQLPADGSVPIQPDSAWKQISVQCIVTDTPGNQSVMQKLVKRPRMASKEPNRFAAAPTSERPGISNAPATEGSGLQIQPAPYRADYANRLRTEPVSNPVIQLDRHRNQPPSPPPGVATAYGLAGNQNYGNQNQGGHPAYAGNAAVPGFRGMQGSVSPQSRPQFGHPAGSSAGLTVGPQVTTASPELSAPPSMTGFPLPNDPPASNGAPGVANIPPANTPPTNALGPTPARSFASQFAQPQTKPVPTGKVEEVLPPPGVPVGEDADVNLNGPQQSETTEVPTPRPQTPAEAMRPIDESSAVDQNTPAGQEPPREQIPTPEPDSSANRASSDRGPAGNASQTNNGGNDDRVQANRRDLTDAQLRSSMQRAPQRFSDSFRFSLEYELEAVGSLGVDAVELYGTVDSGKTWQLWGRDPDRKSPFDIETKEEGEFGFRIVVVGQNGLASPRPLAGESPDIVVVVDNTLPTVRITGAQYGEGDRVGSLVIRYDCADAHLQKRPVALSFSDAVDGPWTTIAAGLRNDGDYVWPADPKLPRKIFLRIDVTDEAGNVGTYILEEPIDAQGLAPRARIRGFQTLSGEAKPPTDDDQTARRSWSLFQ